MEKQAVNKIKNKKTNILIVDDHPIVRYGVSRIIGQDPAFAVCGEAENPKETIQFFKTNKADAVVLDISLEGVLDGLKLTKVLRSKYPSMPILILSMHDEMTYAEKALTAGASGYIMKEESSDKLISALKDILNGEIYVSEKVKKQMLHSFSSPKEDLSDKIVEILSDRECQVFSMIGSGHTTRTIAEKLHVSVKTIETHRSRIKFKLSIDSTPEMVLAAGNWAKKERIAPAF
jgi:DNA-binding NarL/FixJ family response regulator